jgi:hypothetical protein
MATERIKTTALKSYIPIVYNGGTLSLNSLYDTVFWQRVGDFIEIWGSLMPSIGGSGGVQIAISMPSGVTVAQEKIAKTPSGLGNVVGHGTMVGIPSQLSLVAYEGGFGNDRFVPVKGGFGGLAGSEWTAGSAFEFYAKIPVD